MKLKIHETKEVNEMNERNERNEWLIEWMHACMNESINQWINEICRPHLPKVLRTCRFICYFYVKSSSRTFMWNRARAHLADLIFQKPSERLSFYVFYDKPSSGYSPAHVLSTAFADRGPKLRKQRPYFGDHGSHFTRKNTGFRARESFQAWTRAFWPVALPNYDMLMWLTWWCGWPDGENAAHDNRL